jgi:hypothetical protein
MATHRSFLGCYNSLQEKREVEDKSQFLFCFHGCYFTIQPHLDMGLESPCAFYRKVYERVTESRGGRLEVTIVSNNKESQKQGPLESSQFFCFFHPSLTVQPKSDIEPHSFFSFHLRGL